MLDASGTLSRREAPAGRQRLGRGRSRIRMREIVASLI